MLLCRVQLRKHAPNGRLYIVKYESEGHLSAKNGKVFDHLLQVETTPACATLSFIEQSFVAGAELIAGLSLEKHRSKGLFSFALIANEINSDYTLQSESFILSLKLLQRQVGEEFTLKLTEIQDV